MANRSKKVLLNAAVLFIFLSPVFCDAKSWAEKRVAAKIAKEKGVLKPNEVWMWQTSVKDIPQNWNKLDNMYFSVSYDPKCFNIEGEEGESDPKVAPSVIFKRKKTCTGFKDTHGDLNWLIIGYFPYGGVSTIEGASTSDYSLVRQKIKINGIDAVSLTGLMDFYHESTESYDPQLRRQLYIICNKKTFRIGTMIPPGKPTMELVEKSDYAWPEDFKGIISTFSCK